jgi:hypothetical protein
VGAKSADPQGGHVRIYWTLLDSLAYLALSNAARALYVDLRRKLSANNNGDIACTLATMRHRGWRSPATLFNALQELVAVGLVARTRDGGIASMSKVCSLYRFTDLLVYEHPKQSVPACKPTFDYLRFQSLAEARKAIALMREERAVRGRAIAEARKKRKLQKLTGTDSKIESLRAAKDSVTEQRTHTKIQKLNLSKNGRKHANV